jgi:hypothetical protein
MEAVVSRLLPPAYREHVLGDLRERFGESDAGARWLRYAGDAATTVPYVLRSQMRRTVVRRSACAGAVPGDLRRRAEHHQAEVWVRNAIVFFGAAIVFALFLANAWGPWHFHESVSLAMTVGWIGAIWQSYGARGSTMVPAALSQDELRAFHRRALTRQMDIGWREFAAWSMPAALLIVYGVAASVPGFAGKGPFLLGALTMQNIVIGWTHWRVRKRYQLELDRLDQEIGQA